MFIKHNPDSIVIIHNHPHILGIDIRPIPTSKPCFSPNASRGLCTSGAAWSLRLGQLAGKGSQTHWEIVHMYYVFFLGAIPDHMLIIHFDPVPTFARVSAEALNTFEVCAVSKTIYECGALYALCNPQRILPSATYSVWGLNASPLRQSQRDTRSDALVAAQNNFFLALSP